MAGGGPGRLSWSPDPPGLRGGTGRQYFGSGVNVWEIDSPTATQKSTERHATNQNRTRNELVRRSLRESVDKGNKVQNTSPPKKKHTIKDKRKQRLNQVIHGNKKIEGKARSRDVPK